MIKFLKIIGVLILVALVGAAVFIGFSGGKLPEGSEEIIDQIIAEELPELSGETGIAMNGTTQIWYEVQSPDVPVKGDVLLVMGIANDAMAWPAYFIEPLVEAGYRVVRFDNRGTGMSDWVEDWTEENSYSLEDMANDGIAVLNQLEINKAHIIGVSLGGMIAQEISILHPDRVETLTSMMSTAHIMDESMKPINADLIQDLLLASLKYGLLPGEKNQIKFQLAARQLLMGEYKASMDVEDIARSTLYNIRKRKGYNQKASQQQIIATMKSGSRYEALAQSKIPTLIIHGKDDPLIDISHGWKCAEIIPGAQSLWIEKMGHDLPPEFVDEILAAIFAHIEKTPTELNPEM